MVTFAYFYYFKNKVTNQTRYLMSTSIEGILEYDYRGWHVRKTIFYELIVYSRHGWVNYIFVNYNYITITFHFTDYNYKQLQSGQLQLQNCQLQLLLVAC